MEKIDIAIIGAGAVGLAAAWKIASQTDYSVVVIERHKKYGQEISSRNSEVIHSGFYYSPEMLKSQLCVQGNRLLYEFCSPRRVSHRKCGKILAALNEAEEQQLDTLYRRAKDNHVNVTRFTGKEIMEIEPEIYAFAGLYFPDTGVIHSHEYMQALFYEGKQAGVTFLFDTTVLGTAFNGSDYAIITQRETIRAGKVINCAGLGAENIAGSVGIDTQKSGYCIHFCKGEYFKIRKKLNIKHLIYSVPTPNSLGIHLSMDNGGGWRLGPNASYINHLDFTVDENHGDAFFQAASSYLPHLKREDLIPDFAGIRPKLQGPGEAMKDFIIKDELEQGYPGWINLIGIESPGLTSSLAIGEYVLALL